MFGLDYVVFRPHNVYGERQNIADRYRNVVGIFMNQVLTGKPMTVFGDGRQTRAFSHVDDVAPLIARAPLVPAALNQVFNVGADVPHAVLHLAREIAEAFGVEPKLEHLEPRREALHAISDHTKVRGVFAPPPPVDLRTGVRRMAKWVRERGAAAPVNFSDLEITKNLPPSWQR
jgi:UDP-glucose 4-epimerase